MRRAREARRRSGTCWRRVAVHRRPAASSRTRELGDVGLRVPAANAERMQLQDLARQVLVEAARSLLPLARPHAGQAARTDRLRLVEVQQHRRMAHDRQQQVFEAAQHVRADRIGLEAAGQPDDQELVDRDREVVRPEVHQSLDEGGRGQQRARCARAYGRDVRVPPLPQVGLADAASLSFGRLANGALLRQPRLDERGGARQRFPRRRSRLVGLELRQQPALRLRRRRLVGPGAEAEAVQRDGRRAHGARLSASECNCGCRRRGRT